MRTFKSVQNKINWNTWQHKDRETEIRNTIANLAPPWVEEKRNKEVTIEKQTQNEMNVVFSMDELLRALNMIRKDSSPGMDNVDYSMLRHLSLKGKQVLLGIYNIIWTENVVPTDWYTYQVIFIDKIGKDKVRPIALSSCVCKLMERMINERLIWWLERNNKLDPLQNGFRRGKSCMENLAKMVADIESANIDGCF
ncbi:uncharacterized protein LOC113005794 [Solenopsis invicta]|uniref:uncharacterized protein LOC113005794 n=1 Tax=Solenopsis invicta TaxID=13686 RepID=UPI00193C9FB3|nr:uncharacterized protein LOC113005794 [Solenopsis invicta]